MKSSVVYECSYSDSEGDRISQGWMTTCSNKVKVSKGDSGQGVAERRGAEICSRLRIVGTRAVDGKQQREKKRLGMNMSINIHLREWVKWNIWMLDRGA